MNIFIGYDSRESICYDTCKMSLKETSSVDTTVQPIKIDELNVYNRSTDPTAATEFTYSRFLVPYLSEYQGWSLFCDCDFIFVDDISNLISLIDDQYAVMVCKHDYKPTAKTKMDGQIQTMYPRKNWSSLVLWNNTHVKNKQITPDVVNTQTGKFLHRFEWLEDHEIGSIPVVWNWLVGWYKEPDDGAPRALHYTEGGPWFDSFKDCEYAEQWNKYYEMLGSR